jgi:hypothetical protein
MAGRGSDLAGLAGVFEAAAVVFEVSGARVLERR